MVEQNFRFAAPLADRFYVMEHGQIVEHFEAAELAENRTRSTSWASRTNRLSSPEFPAPHTEGKRSHPMKLHTITPHWPLPAWDLPGPPPRRKASRTTSSASVSSPTCPACIRTSTRAAWRPCAWRSKTPAARSTARRSKSSRPTTRTRQMWPRRACASGSTSRRWTSSSPAPTRRPAWPWPAWPPRRPFIAIGAGASDLTNAQCSPFTVHYAYDTVALARGTGSAVVKDGGKSWFFLTADYAGHALERDTIAVVGRRRAK